MHLSLDSAMAIRQNNCMNGLKNDKIKGEKYKMRLDQKHTWL